MKQPIVIAVIALVIGVAIGFGVATLLQEDATNLAKSSGNAAASGDADSKDTSVKSTQEARVANPAFAKGEAEREAPNEIEQSGPSSIAPESAPKSAAVTAVMKEYFVQEVEGTITGVVTTTDGAPLADVTIYAHVNVSSAGARTLSGQVTPYDDGSPEPFEDGWNRVMSEKYVNLRAFAAAYSRQTKTDAQGHYVLTGLTDADYSVSAAKKGYRSPTAGKGSSSTRVGQSKDFVFELITEVLVSVTMPDGSVPERAYVQLTPVSVTSGSQEVYLWTKQAPKIQHRFGVWQISAYTDERVFASPSTSIRFYEGEAAPPILLQLAPQTRLDVAIVFEMPERAVNYISLYVLEVGASKSAKENITREGKQLYRFQKGGNPLYAWMDAKPGFYEVYAIDSGEMIASTPATVVAEEISHAEILIPSFRREDYIEVRVEGLLQVNGGHISWVLGVEKGAEFRRTGARAVPRGEGYFWLKKETPEHQFVNPMTYLEVKSQLQGSVAAYYTDGPNASVTLKFAAPATLRVKINGFDRESKSAQHMSITLVPVPNGGLTPREPNRLPGARLSSVDDDGYIYIVGYSVGKYILEVGDGPREYKPALVSMPVTLVEGKNEAEVLFPQYFELNIEILEEPTRGIHRLELQQRGLRVASENARTKGVVSFGDLPTGEYTLVLKLGGDGKDQRMTFTHASAASVVFVPNE